MDIRSSTPTVLLGRSALCIAHWCSLSLTELQASSRYLFPFCSRSSINCWGKDDAFCYHLCLVNIAPEQLLGFSFFFSPASSEAHFATRIPNIHRVGTWDLIGGVIRQSLSHCVSKVFHTLTLGLTNFYWNCCFVEVENNLLAEPNFFKPEEATLTFSLTSN